MTTTTYNPIGKGPICSRMMAEDEIDREKNTYMNSKHSTSFIQFKQIPKMLNHAAIILKCMETKGLDCNQASRRLKTWQLNTGSKRLVHSTMRHKKELDYVLNKVPIMSECPFFDLYVIKILADILLASKQPLPLETLEASNILYYESDLRETLLEANIVFGSLYTAELPIYVRVNTLSISLEQCVDAFCKEGWKLLQCPKSYREYLVVVSQLKEREFVRDFHISELFVFPPRTLFYNHPGYLRGKFVLQDKGSCLASFLLNPKPGARVYDMGAAPGRSTNHLANIINNEGVIYAVDNHPHRYNRLYSFLQLTHTSCAETMLGDITQVKFDNLNYILFDAPSTYTGIYHQRTKEGLTDQLKEYFRASFKALTYALLTFTTVKRVVFSSCSMFPEEGQKVVHSVLNQVGNSYYLLDVKELLWNEWLNVGDTNGGIYPSATKCLRTKPNIDKCQGYFIAVFERNFQVPVPSYKLNDLNDTIEMRDHEANDETSIDISQEQEHPLQNLKRQPRIHKALKKKKKKLSRSLALQASTSIDMQNSNSVSQQML